MNNILLISEDTLKTYSNLNDNTFGKWILPAIKESQEMGLMPIIGECLYNKICELVADGSINDVLFTAYKDLLDDKIQPYLIYKTLSNIIPILNAKMANIGTVLTNDEHVVNLTQGESDLLKTYYSERCDFYTKRLQDFIKNNQSAFPEIACGCGNMQPNLESSENSVGVWLGGTRGKRISDNKCGCSSTEVTCADYQSGFTDGVEFQKRKLEITGFTENGRYIREDGYSEVTVDVPQTGYTEEEMLERYSQGYRQGQYFQKTLMTSVIFDENGTYTRGNGYSAVTVNVPQSGHTDEELEEAYNSGYTSGYTSGETHQKSLLSTLTVTQNGNYSRANGYSAITVNVAGQEPSLQTKNIIANGQYTPDAGYDGFSSVNVNVPQTGHTDEEMRQQYQSGKTAGIAEQKAKLSAITITQNGNYNRADGYSAITVNVPTSSEMYQSGYTDGYNDAYNELGYIDVVPASNNMHYNDTGVTLTVTSNIPWVISNYPAWAVPNKLSGNGNSTVTVMLQENEGAERRGYVDFNSTHGSIVTSVYIRQGSQPSPTPTPTGVSEYLTFRIQTGGDIRWRTNSATSPKTISYSKDDGATWSAITSNSQGAYIHVNAGDIVRLKGDNASYSGNGFTASTSVAFTVEGNIMSLINSTGFATATTLTASDTFNNLFAKCYGLTSAENLKLPATSLTPWCYAYMFSGCYNLTTAPELPATNLADSCYSGMFIQCTSLTIAPALPATTLAEYCYSQMFERCSALAVAPVLSASTLVEGCYSYMFQLCGSLNNIKCFATNISATDCTREWVDRVAASGVFYKKSGVSSWSTGENGIPSGWTIRNS